MQTNHLHKRNSRAAELMKNLNSDDARFVELYSSVGIIRENNLFRYLNERNQIALRFCKSRDCTRVKMHEQDVLKWIVQSSYDNEIDSDAFQDIIDRTVTKLLLIYHDNTVLDQVVTIMFNRYREDQCIYDLCWAFYQSQTIDTLPLVAYYLLSDNPMDNELANKLLNFKPELQPNNKRQQYMNFMTWYNENKDFLYFNEDNLQETCRPKYWRVDLMSKYICRQKNEELPETERNNLSDFRKLDRAEQKKLSKYSYNLFKTDKQSWKKWFSNPLQTQQYTTQAWRGKND